MQGRTTIPEFEAVLGKSRLCMSPAHFSPADACGNAFVTVEAGRPRSPNYFVRELHGKAVTSLRQAIAKVGLDSAYHLQPAVDFSHDVLTNVTQRLQVLRDRTSGWVDLGSPARVLATLTQNGIEPEWVTEQDRSISSPGKRTVVRQ